jgi:hypothetical protein
MPPLPLDAAASGRGCSGGCTVDPPDTIGERGEGQATMHGLNDQETEDRRCPACGKPYAPGDRYCSECGRPLPTSRGVEPARLSDTRHPTPGTSPSASRPEDGRAWIFGAKPAAVVGGGFLLLLLAAALLWVGQRDDTGTIVMLSICVAPLALLTIVIGVARAVSRTAQGAPRD